jgi:hypothetical protein
MAEMKFLRKVGHTLQYELSNLTIQNDLQIFSTGQKDCRVKKNWHKHLAPRH